MTANQVYQDIFKMFDNKKLQEVNDFLNEEDDTDEAKPVDATIAVPEQPQQVAPTIAEEVKPSTERTDSEPDGSGTVTAEAPCDNPLSVLQKFATSVELEEAYLRLCKDYTRKSQELAVLKGLTGTPVAKNETITSDAKTIQVHEIIPVSQVVTTDTQRQKERETILTQSVTTPPQKISLREDVIAEYLTLLSKKETAPIVLTTGEGVVAGNERQPRELRQSAKLAEQYFKNKKLGD